MAKSLPVIDFWRCAICRGKGFLRSWVGCRQILEACRFCDGVGHRLVRIETPANEA